MGVLNILRFTTEPKICAMFKVYGTVQYCNLVMDKETGESKGFAFVEMPNPGNAKAATKNINGKEVAGSKLRVKKAQ